MRKSIKSVVFLIFGKIAIWCFFHSVALSQPICDPHPKYAENLENRLFPNFDLVNCPNNGWYRYNDSDTVFVFVHGILSDSRAAWFNLDEKIRENNKYWPELVSKDQRFGAPSVFLAGYYTEINSGIYDIRAAANDIFEMISTPLVDGRDAVLAKKNIIFVAHSTGGIAVRHLLTRAWRLERLRDKVIGLVLVASPSLGAKDADRLAAALEISKNRMAQQLRWYNSFLTELDKDFRSFLHNKTLPYLTGTELVENHFVVKWLGFFKRPVVVADSAARYFDEGHPIGGTTHFSIAKPTDFSHKSHQKLVTFFTRQFRARVDEAVNTTHRKPKVILMDNFSKIYERNPVPGEMNSHVIQRNLQGLKIDADDIEPVHANWSNEKEIIKKQPDLIIIHYSSFDDPSKSKSHKKNRLKRFLSDILEETNETKFVIYTRTKREIDYKKSKIGKDLVPHHFKSRIIGFPVNKYDASYNSFRNERVSNELREVVKDALELR